MSAPYRIASLAFGMTFGSTEKAMCPSCLGGSQMEESLSITVADDGGIFWLCHRASCGYKGGPRGKRPVGGPRKPLEPRVYTRSTKALTPDQNEILRSKYGAYFPCIRYNDSTDRFLLPISGSGFGSHRGWIARSFSGDSPKVLSYVEGEPFIHFAYPREVARRYIIIVVEDYFSAEKVSRAGFTGVSLNGTNMNQMAVDEIKSLKDLGTVVIALDLDAYPKALQLQAKYREQFPNGLLVMKLEKDLKFESEERIIELVEEVRAGTTNNCGDPQGSGSI